MERLAISSRKLEISRTFHARMDTIKDRNGKDLIKAQEMKKSGNNTQKKYTKKVLMTWITMMM